MLLEMGVTEGRDYQERLAHRGRHRRLVQEMPRMGERSRVRGFSGRGVSSVRGVQSSTSLTELLRALSRRQEVRGDSSSVDSNGYVGFFWFTCACRGCMRFACTDTYK